MFATPALAEKKPPYPVMVYALAWDNCLSVLGYQLEMTDSANYSKARDAVRGNIAKKFPNAKGTRAGSSKFDFGDKAGAVSVIEVDNSDSSCKIRSVLVNFGVDEADALERRPRIVRTRCSNSATS